MGTAKEMQWRSREGLHHPKPGCQSVRYEIGYLRRILDERRVSSE